MQCYNQTPATTWPKDSPLDGLLPADILVGQPIDQPMGQIDGEGGLVRLPLAPLLLAHRVLELGLDLGKLGLQIIDLSLEVLQPLPGLQQLLMGVL